MLRRVILGSGLGGLLLVVSQSAAAAAFDPYSSGSVGYDYSYVQCGSSTPAGAFGIVGVNGGYPFTYYNSCLSTQLASAARTGNAAVYVNTGYDPSYTAIDGRHTTQDCATRSQSVVATAAQRAAWAVGCSEAQRDAAYATSQSGLVPTAWWLDVETANSWSTSDLTLNQYSITGLVATLRTQTAAPVGIYSTPQQWSQITGGFHPAVDADWLATGERTLRRARTHCGSAGFTGAKVWLVQYVSTFDTDYVC